MALLILGCSNDNSSTPNVPVNVRGTKLIQINEDWLDNNHGTTTKFIYVNGVVSKREYSQNGTTFYDETTKFNYENNRLKSLSFSHGSYPTGTETYTYKGDLITSCVSTKYSTTEITSYEYNANNQMIKMISTSATNNQASGQTFEYNSFGNLYKNPTIPFNSSYNAIYDTFNSYDDQKNPYSLVFSDSFMKIFLYSKNNNTKKTGFNNNPISTYEYVYNKDGYPTQKIETVDGIPHIKTTYTYE
jgi:hypothetical protein